MTDLEVGSTELLADWIEISVIVSDTGRFGVDKLFALAEAELALEPSKVSMALKVMERRSRILGSCYPFDVNDLGVLRRLSPYQNSYTTLLLLTPGSSARQLVRTIETAEMAELLELVTERALTNFWGPGGQAVQFGHPSRHGRPREFDQAITWLADRMGLLVGSGYRPPRRKDGGVDVVAWRQFHDGRLGFPIALAQCTIQAQALTKTTDIDLRLWASWLAMDMEPLSLLVVPGTIRAAGPDWRQLSSVVLPIERLRLIELLQRGGLSDEPERWTEDALGELRTVMKAGEL